MELWPLAIDWLRGRLSGRMLLILNFSLFIILLIHREEAIASAHEHVRFLTH